MKKRVFIPHSIGFILLNILFWGLTSFGISMIVGYFCGVETLFEQTYENILFVFATIFLLCTSIRFLLCLKISLRKDDIYTFGDLLPKFEKVQYKCRVKYSEIQNISLIISNKDSKNQDIQLRWTSSNVQKKYLEFTLMNEKKERVCINYYTKSQIIKMLNYINENMKTVGNENTLNIEEIMNNWYSHDKNNKKDIDEK